ncbi:MAG: hypothetical protein M3Y89_16720, partial [Actinomycetota bacterium]|nr:hypothetical protein [Actinomycetota bacterium]
STSNLNYTAHQSTANLVITPVGPDGKITLYNGSTGPTDLIADIAGYYLSGTPSSPGSYAPLTPSRLLDTRTGNGAPKTPLPAHHTITLTITGRNNLPTTGLAAIALTLTAINPTTTGWISSYPSGTTRPSTSNLNYTAHQSTANLVITPVGPDGKITLYNGSTGPTDLIADLAGYYLSCGDCAPATFTPTQAPDGVGPQRSFPGAVACPAAGSCIAVGGGDNSASILTLAGGTWTPMPVPPLPANANGTAAGLSWVVCPAVDYCVAAGSYTEVVSGNNLGLIETLSNGSWSAIQAPVPADALDGSGLIRLSDLACGAVGSCVLVGNYVDTAGDTQALSDVLSAGSWTPVRLPLPAVHDYDPLASLASVACPAAGACTAVGSYDVLDSTTGPLVETLSGGIWSATAAPLPTGYSSDGAGLTSVSCPATGWCLAVGPAPNIRQTMNGFVDTLSDGQWTSRDAPMPANASSYPFASLGPVTCVAVGSCTMVGQYDDNQAPRVSRVLLASLADGRWSSIQAPLPADAIAKPHPSLRSLSCVSAGSCVAVGSYTGDLGQHALIEILSGGQWTAVQAPEPADGEPNYGGALYDVGCAPDGSYVALGWYYTTVTRQVEGVLEQTP